MSTPASGARKLRFDDFELDTLAGELRKRGVRLRLRGQPLQVLATLLNRAGDVVTREELREQIWTADTFVDFDHSLHNAVARLREVLGDSAETPRYIETLPRRGYRFIGRMDGMEEKAPEAETPTIEEGDHGRTRTQRRLHWLAPAGVAVLVLLAIAYAMSRSSTRNAARPSTPAKITSLAVLPLKNLSGDPTEEYLADGMTEALIGRLSQIRDLRVASHTSITRFKNPQMSVPEIAATLHVDAIVEGSVIREGNRIRVTADLIRGATDEQLWSETYDRNLQNVLALQSDVAQAITEKVEVVVTGEEHAGLVAARHVRPEVYENYIQGSYELDKGLETLKRPDFDKSIIYFQDAVKEDPSFAPAYVGLAVVYSKFGSDFFGDPPDPALQKEMDAARIALQLDPNLADAHVLLAGVLISHWHWADAEAEYKRALELSPNDSYAHDGLAWWLLYHGRTDEALAWERRARELDPLAVDNTDVGWMLFESRRYDESLHELRSALGVQPNDTIALWDLGTALLDMSQSRDAVPALEKAVSLSNRSPGIIGTLARAYAQAGRRSDALRLVAELNRRRKAGFVPAGPFVNAYIGLGDKDQAFNWLEQAYMEHSNILRFLKVDPTFDPLRSDPRFADLLRRVGLAY